MMTSSEPILHGILDQVKAQCAMQHSLGDNACVTQVSDMRPTLYVGCQPLPDGVKGPSPTGPRSMTNHTPGHPTV